jgi:hypothetical protein
MTRSTIRERSSSRPVLAVLAAGAVLGAAVVPSAASAAVVSKTGSVVTYQAAPGEINQVLSSSRTDASACVSPTRPLLFAALGCQIVIEQIRTRSVTRVVTNLGDMNDQYFGAGTGSVPATVNADAGNDEMVDGAGPARKEICNGGSGIDKASYVLASGAVSLSLDGLSNDGEAARAT